MLALIIFSFLIGFGKFAFWRKGPSFRSFLSSGDEGDETIAALDNENGSNRIRPYFAYQVGILWPSIVCGAYAEAIGSLLWSLCFYFVVFLASMRLCGRGQMG
jgi:hypothetical protein